MRRFVKHFLGLFFAMNILCSCASFSLYNRYANDKITRMQNLVGFSQEHAVRLKEAEVRHTKAMVANCGDYKKQQKLEAKRQILLQNILGKQKAEKFLAIERKNVNTKNRKSSPQKHSNF